MTHPINPNFYYTGTYESSPVRDFADFDVNTLHPAIRPAATHLLEKGILTNEILNDLRAKQDCIEELGQALDSLKNADLLTLPNFNTLMANIDHIKDLSKGFQYLQQEPNILNQGTFDALIKNKEHAEGLGWGLSSFAVNKRTDHAFLIENACHALNIAEGFQYLYDADMATEENCAILKQNPRYAAKLGYGLCCLKDYAYVTPRTRAILAENAPHAEELGRAFVSLADVGLTEEEEEEIQNALIANAPYAANLAGSFTDLAIKNLLDEDIRRALIEHAPHALKLSQGLIDLHTRDLFEYAELRKDLIENPADAIKLATLFIYLANADLHRNPEIRKALIADPLYANKCIAALRSLGKGHILTRENITTLFSEEGLYAQALAKYIECHPDQTITQDVFENVMRSLSSGNDVYFTSLCFGQAARQGTYGEATPVKDIIEKIALHLMPDAEEDSYYSSLFKAATNSAEKHLASTGQNRPAAVVDQTVTALQGRVHRRGLFPLEGIDRFFAV